MKNINAERTKNRRSFLRRSLATGAAIAGATALGERKLFGQNSGSLNTGDVAILKFVAAAELIETDLWQQYAELGGVTHEAQNPYQLAFQNLDSDGSQYISSNTLDEQTAAQRIPISAPRFLKHCRSYLPGALRRFPEPMPI